MAKHFGHVSKMTKILGQVSKTAKWQNFLVNFAKHHNGKNFGQVSKTAK